MVKLTLCGNFAVGVYARDLGAHIWSMAGKRQLPSDLDYRILEFR